MTAVELNQVAAAVDDIAPEIYNADKKEVLAKAATFLRLFGEALDLERKTDWEKYVKKHADFLDDLAVSGLFEVVSSSKFKAASILLNEMWQSFTHKANMLGLNHRITELEELVTRCLKTGSIRVDDHLDLWDDIHARLKLHQGEPQPEPMTAWQKFKDAKGRIKELESKLEEAQAACETVVQIARMCALSKGPMGEFITMDDKLIIIQGAELAGDFSCGKPIIDRIKQLEADLKLAREATASWSHAYQESSAQNTQLREDLDQLERENSQFVRIRNAQVSDWEKSVKDNPPKRIATGTAQQCFEESQEWAKRCAHAHAELAQSRATIAALDPILRETIDSINSLRNAYANSPVNPAWVRVIDARNKLSAFLASTALKNEGGKNES